MPQYDKPKVTIDLDEYTALKKKEAQLGAESWADERKMLLWTIWGLCEIPGGFAFPTDKQKMLHNRNIRLKLSREGGSIEEMVIVERC